MLRCENLYTFCTTSQWVCEGLKPTRICLYTRQNYFCWLSLCLSCSSLRRELCWMLVSQVVGRVEGAFFLPTTQNPIMQTVHVAVALSAHNIKIFPKCKYLIWPILQVVNYAFPAYQCLIFRVRHDDVTTTQLYIFIHSLSAFTVV